jgi:hypothetical protein
VIRWAAANARAWTRDARVLRSKTRGDENKTRRRRWQTIEVLDITEVEDKRTGSKRQSVH